MAFDSHLKPKLSSIVMNGANLKAEKQQSFGLSPKPKRALKGLKKSRNNRAQDLGCSLTTYDNNINLNKTVLPVE